MLWECWTLSPTIMKRRLIPIWNRSHPVDNVKQWKSMKIGLFPSMQLNTTTSLYLIIWWLIGVIVWYLSRQSDYRSINLYTGEKKPHNGLSFTPLTGFVWTTFSTIILGFTLNGSFKCLHSGLCMLFSGVHYLGIDWNIHSLCCKFHIWCQHTEQFQSTVRQ